MYWQTHGHCKNYHRSRTYNVWHKMRQRCFNPKDPKYPNYGGRGITIDPRWMVFETFLEDMGVCPDKHSIDRIDNNANYCKANCKWSTNKEQCNNRRSCRYLEFNGKKMTHQQWAESLGFKEGSAIAFRLKSGWTIEEALTTRKGQSRTSRSETCVDTMSQAL